MELTYDKMDGFATFQGQELEIFLSALLVLRGRNRNCEIQLGANVKGAGAMDDIVFRYKPSGEDTWKTLYIQLKYKATKKVEQIMLTASKGEFSVQKYYQSYLDIMKAVSNAVRGSLFDGDLNKSVFVIYTNGEASELSGIECRRNLTEAEEFVWCGSGNVFSFEEDEDILNRLTKLGADGQVFLGRLRLFCGQPDAKQLEAVIKEELKKVDPKVIQGVKIKSLLKEFLRRFRNWWEKKGKAEVLHRDYDLLRSSILELISQRTKKDYVLDLDFEEDVLASLHDSVTDGCKVVNVQSSESSCRLSLTKLCQAFGGQPLVLDCAGLLANQGALPAYWKDQAEERRKRKEEKKKKEEKIEKEAKENEEGKEKKKRKVEEESKEKEEGDETCLIISTNDWTSSLQEGYFKAVKALLAIRDTPSIVFLSKNKNSAFEAIAKEFQESVKSFGDDFLFSQLKEASRGKVLAKEVSLQGHSTTFSQVFNNAPGGADKVLDACSVVEILDCNDSLTLGDALDEGIDIYVDRRLGMSTVVKNTVFQDGALQGNVTVRVSATDNRTGLFDKAVAFLSSLQVSKSLLNVNTGQIVSDLSNSLLFPDEGDPEVFIGPTFALGSFKCNSVGLRFGQQDAVTALRVHSSKHSTQAGFLFVSDKTSENDARKLFDFHQSKHLLSLENGQLRWIRSQGDIEWIRPHIDKDKTQTIAPENIMDVEDRLVLVCAEPGMGKSTLMARLAKNTKAAHPHHFIFLIALNDHTALLKNISVDENTDALGFLCSAHKIESHLHRSLIKFALEESGQVVVLFDGFDEIAENYDKQCRKLLESLREGTKASKVWMTSRNSVKIQVEEKISSLAMTLCKFTPEDQKIFLNRFWAAKSELSGNDLEFQLCMLQNAFQHIDKTVKDFLCIPLHTWMLADGYKSDAVGMSGRSLTPLTDMDPIEYLRQFSFIELDLLSLLEKFVDMKFGVYSRTKSQVAPHSTEYKHLMKSIKKDYVKKLTRASLVLILGDDISNMQQMESVKNKFLKFSEKIKSGKEKTGFIDSIVDGKPRFIHRVFAEYFVALWFSENFAEHRELVESKLFTDSFAMIRDMFDRLLAKNLILHTAVISGNWFEVDKVLKREDVDVNAKDRGGRKALHIAACRGVSSEWGENEWQGQILDRLIKRTSNLHEVDDILGGSAIKYADVTRSWIAVNRLLPHTKDKDQLTVTLENGNNISTLIAMATLEVPHIFGFYTENRLDISAAIPFIQFAHLAPQQVNNQ